MSKIYIKTTLKNSNEVHTFEGMGIKDGNKITYNDNGVMTKISFDESVILERISDYYIKICFDENKQIKGIYDTKEGKFETETSICNMKIENNSIKIEYKLMINNVFIDTFIFNLQYTIDR